MRTETPRTAKGVPFWESVAKERRGRGSPSHSEVTDAESEWPRFWRKMGWRRTSFDAALGRSSVARHLHPSRGRVASSLVGSSDTASS